MKVKRSYEFKLFSLNSQDLEKVNKSEINDFLTFVSKSECHYYCEKEAIEMLKIADKNKTLSEYVNAAFVIYKCEKDKKIVTEEQKSANEKIICEKTISGKVALIETMLLDKELNLIIK